MIFFNNVYQQGFKHEDLTVFFLCCSRPGVLDLHPPGRQWQVAAVGHHAAVADQERGGSLLFFMRNDALNA